MNLALLQKALVESANEFDSDTQVHFAVTSGYAATDLGAFNLSITGSGQVVPAPPALPLFAGMGVSLLTLLRRRRRALSS